MRGRWWALILLGVALLSAVLVDRPSGPTGQVALSAPAPVRIAIFADPKTLDPALANTPAELAATDNLYQALLGESPSGQILPGLARVASENGKQLVLDVVATQFVNGEKVNPIIAAEGLARPLWQSGSAAATLLAPVVGINQVTSGASTYLSGVQPGPGNQLIITLKKPVNANFLAALANPVLGIMDPKWTQRGGAYWSALDAYGSGGYRLVTWNPGQSLDFQRVFGKGPASVSLVEYASWGLAVQSLQNGLVDAVPVSPAQLTSVPHGVAGDLHLLPTPGTVSWYWSSPKASAPLALSLTPWIRETFSGHVTPLPGAYWPGTLVAAKTATTVFVDKSDAWAMALANTLQKAAPGKIVVQAASPAAIQAGIKSGSVTNYLGSTDWYSKGDIAMPLVRTGAFWLVRPSLWQPGLEVFPDGTLDWHSVR